MSCDGLQPCSRETAYCGGLPHHNRRLQADRRTAHVEEPAWTNLIQFNEPLPRRTATQRTLAPSRSA